MTTEEPTNIPMEVARLLFSQRRWIPLQGPPPDHESLWSIPIEQRNMGWTLLPEGPWEFHVVQTWVPPIARRCTCPQGRENCCHIQAMELLERYNSDLGLRTTVMQMVEEEDQARIAEEERRHWSFQ